MGNNKEEYRGVGAQKCVALLFMLLWTYAALSKVLRFSLFKSQMRYLPLPERWMVVLPVLVPSMELLLVILLLFPGLYRLSILLSTAAMLLFTGYVVYVLGEAPSLRPCSCGGVINSLGWKGHLVFNLAWTSLGLFGFCVPIRKKKI